MESDVTTDSQRGNIASGSALAHGVCRSLLVCERGSAGSIGSKGGGEFRYTERRKTSYV